MNTLNKNINIFTKYIIAIETINFQIGRKFIEFLVDENILDRETFDDYKDTFDSMLNLDEKINDHNKTKNNNSSIIFEAVVFLQNERSWNKERLLELSSLHQIEDIVNNFIYKDHILNSKKIEKVLKNHKFQDDIYFTYFGKRNTSHY